MRLLYSEYADKYYYISKYPLCLMNVIIYKYVKCYSLMCKLKLMYQNPENYYSGPA